MARAVISADDVRAAHRRREHRLAVPAGAIVTPLARDEAAKWGIEIVAEEPAAGGPAGTTGLARGPSAEAGRAAAVRHVPTCDPDDLERVIERVRKQVPDADPAVVREIAERVLRRVGGP